MSMKFVCNRCNKIREAGESFHHLNYIAYSPYDDAEYDLCPECSKQFDKFMKGGEVVEEDHYKDSKPHAVVIHKLASGHYAIDNAPEGDEEPKRKWLGWVSKKEDK